MKTRAQTVQVEGSPEHEDEGRTQKTKGWMSRYFFVDRLLYLKQEPAGTGDTNHEGATTDDSSLRPDKPVTLDTEMKTDIVAAARILDASHTTGDDTHPEAQDKGDTHTVASVSRAIKKASRIQKPGTAASGAYRRMSTRVTANHHGNADDKNLRPAKSAPPQHVISKMRMSRIVLQAIENTIGEMPAETGGMLLGSVEDYLISDFIFDNAADTTAASYTPNTAFLNRHLKGQEDRFIGIVHSHPPGYRHLSQQDLRAAWSNLTSKGNPHLNAYLMPLVMTVPDTGSFEIIPFIVVCDPWGHGAVIARKVEIEYVD